MTSAVAAVRLSPGKIALPVLDLHILIPALCLGGAVVNLALGALGARKGAVTVVGVGSVGAATVATFATLWHA